MVYFYFLVNHFDGELTVCCHCFMKPNGAKTMNFDLHNFFNMAKPKKTNCNVSFGFWLAPSMVSEHSNQNFIQIKRRIL